MYDRGKSLTWLYGEIKTPPFSATARNAAGLLLRRLQRGELLSLPHSRPMPRIGRRCHELRVIYRIDLDAIVVVDVLEKKTRETPQHVIETCRKRLRDYDSL